MPLASKKNTWIRPMRRPCLLPRTRFNTRARMEAYAEMAELFGRAPRASCLRGLAEDLGGGPASPKARFVEILALRMAKGLSLSQAMAGWVPEQERARVASAERAGNVVLALRAIRLDHYARRRDARHGPWRGMIRLAGAAGVLALAVTGALHAGLPEAMKATTRHGLAAAALPGR